MCVWGTNKLCHVYVSAEDSHTGRSHWTYKDVDACLADQVNELNAQGRLTRSACCGHGKIEGQIILHDGTVIITGMTNQCSTCHWWGYKDYVWKGRKPCRNAGKTGIFPVNGPGMYTDPTFGCSQWRRP